MRDTLGVRGQKNFPSLKVPTQRSLVLLLEASVRVTLRLAVYRESFRLGAKPREAHDQSNFWRDNN
jgi:hypothetical protein